MKGVNGFKIVQDLGLFDNGIRYGIVKCKECKMEFQTSLYHLKVLKSCGCLPCRPPKELPNEINGFKIIQDLGYSNGSRRAICICKVCQKEYEVDPNKLKYRKHCGCIVRGTKVSSYHKTHKRLVLIFRHMMSRCYRKTNQDYYNYGARGIKVCDEWKLNSDNFCEWSLNNGYKDNLSIDRVDSNGNYEPDNCRWANEETQGRNTSRNVLTIELANEIRSLKEKMTYKELSIKFNVSKGTIAAVLSNRIWKN